MGEYSLFMAEKIVDQMELSRSIMKKYIMFMIFIYLGYFKCIYIYCWHSICFKEVSIY